MRFSMKQTRKGETMSLDEMDFNMTGMDWRERLPHLTQIDFTPGELEGIGRCAAMDLLTNSEMRTLVILFAQVRIV